MSGGLDTTKNPENSKEFSKTWHQMRENGGKINNRRGKGRLLFCFAFARLLCNEPLYLTH